MRIGVYVDDLPAEEGGGYTYQRDVLAATAAKADETAHELVAVGTSLAPPSEWAGRPYVSLHRSFGWRVAGKARRTGRRLAASRRGDATAATRADELMVAAGIDLTWCLGGGTPTYELPYVAMVWDLQHRIQPWFPEVSRGDEWLVRERFHARNLQQASVVVVGTEAGRAEVERFYGVPAERIHKLPHPTPSFALDAPPSDTQAVLARHGLSSGYLLYPAQFWAHKNHVGLLHALARLRDEHGVNLDVVFVGADKGNRDHVRRVTERLGLTSQVHVLGFVSRADLVALYRGALALAYVTFFGPENLPPLEAFALGCPVVASHVAGAEEQLGDAAILVDPRDDAQIAAALATVHHDGSVRDELVARGYRRAKAFTAADLVSGMFAIFDQLAPVIRTWR